MARIYKESRYVLQLLIGKSYVAQYDNVKISFYTKNPSNQVMVDDDITIKRNVAEVMVESTLFDNLEEGLIKYIVYGTKDGIPFIEERISNYFLKTPLDFKPTTCILEDKSVTPSMGDIDDNGYIIIEKSEGYDGLSRVVIDPQTIFNEGFEAGIGECSGPAPAPPQDGWGMTGYFNDWGSTPDIPFEENGEWDGRPYKVIRNFEATGGEFKIRRNNAWTDSYTASFRNIPQFAKLIKGDSNMSINDGVWDIYLFFGNDGVPNEMLVLNPGTDLSTIQYEYTLTISTDKENAIIDIDDSYERMGYRYYGSVTVTMKYGCIYNINVHMEGYEDISDEITCYNDEERNYTLTKIEGGSCNLGVLDWTLTSPSTEVKNASDDGYDGYSEVFVSPENLIAQEKENAVNDFKKGMDEITITKNGTYSAEDQETRQYIEFDGNSYFDTGIASTENMKIEVAITKTTYEEDEQFIGCAQFSLLNNESETYGGFGIVAGEGLTYGCFGQRKTGNIQFSMEEEQILTLDITGLESSLYGRADWSNDGDLNYGLGERTIAIGKINSRDGWVYRGLNGRIRYVKIWTNKDDDSTMTLFRPKNMAQGAFGVVNSEGIETGHIENLGSGTATFVEENVKKYPNGFKRVEVNVVPQISIKEEGLNVWYNDLTRITDENNNINSDWDLALKGETIQNVFPGIAMTISGQAVAKPFFIDAVNGNSTATKIGKLVSSEYGTPVSCAVVTIGAFDCKNIQNVDIEAFKYMTDLCFIDGMNGLGESFISPQTINFTYCTNLFIKSNSRKFISNFAESLFNLSAGNKNGINKSTLRFKSAVQERSENADAIALMRSKGWTVEFVSSDL